jgi:hypothetical protein
MTDRTGIPHNGWTLDGVIDLMPRSIDEYATCEWCGNERIRFVHHLSHADHFENLQVGCICSGHLTGDPAAAQKTEKAARNRSAQRERFPLRKWKTTRYGALTTSLNGRQVTVVRKNQGFKVWIDSREGTKTYTSEQVAMLAAFDFITR